MKLSIETRAAWKAHGAQALVVLCHRIHQFKSNSKTLNTWVRQVLCSEAAYKKRVEWVSKQHSRLSWLQIPNEPKLVISLDLLPHSLRQGLSYAEKPIFLLAGLISLQVSMLPNAACTCDTKDSTHAFQHAQKSKTSLFSIAPSDLLVGVLQTHHKSFICITLYMTVIASDKFNRAQFSSAYARHGPHYFKASTPLLSYGIQTKTCQVLVQFYN